MFTEQQNPTVTITVNRIDLRKVQREIEIVKLIVDSIEQKLDTDMNWYEFRKVTDEYIEQTNKLIALQRTEELLINSIEFAAV